ncbi:2,3-diaminopropionate biosynthesis protein SbnB [Micromonospora echinofusca]|uniref:2,3-diaminopropionate biosynthesis protein SbnB n=1 Tax=Micromonospora echinofusca TaxID=47858 RepID=A0ABS3VN79_MICEH|nr:2,3-diaminopropionate biosynthesis protein SbnB [Micromonospora echinofusca]MBO4205980.1 2,3-diaminopropionate biosynthesis protein SbnB [Micromonospora echinofusca]
MLIISAGEVRQILSGREDAVLDAVRHAYVRHAQGRTVLPHSVFLRFPSDARNRIIGLPAFLDDDTPVAGMKWISSFPGNIDRGLARASAAIIVNSMENGHPVALIEGSTISARRTAASAALAAGTLAPPATGVSLVGCGVINFEVLRFLRAVLPDLAEVTVFDLDVERATAFARRCARWNLKVTVASSTEEALGAHPLVCLATTAGVPHLGLAHCRPGALVLHLSLRDIFPADILGAVNVVDDADHVCRAATSLHLAEQETGNRDFIAAGIGEVLGGTGWRHDPERVTVYSPFGLGVLDLAVAELVRRTAEQVGVGTRLPDFLTMPPEDPDAD